MRALGSMPGLDVADGSTDFIYWASLTAVSAIVMLLFACVYKKRVVNEIGELPRSMHFMSNELSLFICLKKPQTCLHTVFCMPVVLGKNYNAVGVMGFWPGCIFSFLLTYTPLWPLGVLIRAILAKKVQDIIGHKTTMLKACVNSLCCMPCDVGRESEEVDDELGAEISCCCKATVTPRFVNEVNDVKHRLCDDGFGKTRICGQ